MLPLLRTSLLCFGPLTVTLAATTGPAPAGWEMLARASLEEARGTFAAGATTRLSLVGSAVALLELPPKTAARVAEASRQLEAVVNENPQDEAGLVAQWVLARIAQHHRAPAQTAEAQNRYRTLFETGGTHPLAQQAAVKLAMLSLYHETQPVAARVAEMEALAARVSEPAARRDFLLLVARARQFFRLPDPPTLDLLLAAEHTGALGHQDRANVLFSIAEMARRLERPADAIAAARQFLQLYPRDERVHTLREWLAQLSPAP